MPDGTDGAVDAAGEAGVTAMVTVGCDRATSLAAIDVAERHDDVCATVGLHPHEAVHGVDTIVDLFDTAGIVAVGEAGLDYYYDHSPRERAAARSSPSRSRLANDLDLPLVIHTRDAWDDTFDVLDAEGVPDAHDLPLLHRRARRGAHVASTSAPTVSFSGIVTFKGAPDVQAAARLCRWTGCWSRPTARTSRRCPTAARPNRPAWVPHVGQFIADLRDDHRRRRRRGDERERPCGVRTALLTLVRSISVDHSEWSSVTLRLVALRSADTMITPHRDRSADIAERPTTPDETLDDPPPPTD